jgi:hypothetical protein
MHKFLRIVFIIIGSVSLVLAAGFCLQLPWATSLWPWADSFLPYTFLGAITAAAAASLLWVGLSGELGTAAGGAINLIVFYAGLTISLYLLSQQRSDQRLLIGALFCALGALVSIGIFLWFYRYPIRSSQPTPLLVRVSFVVFTVLLLSVGWAVLLQIPNVFAWKLIPEFSILIGCFFIGASSYFFYGLVRSSWYNACGQLWAFLAYDLVLIVPYLQHFATVSPARLPSLIINTAVLVYSAVVAVYYLLLNKGTRTWGKSRSETVTASKAAEQEEMTWG